MLGFLNKRINDDLVELSSYFSQYLLRTELPIFIFYNHSRCHISNLIDLTRVMDGPRAL
jgi:hypothetical protein